MLQFKDIINKYRSVSHFQHLLDMYYMAERL